MQREWQLEELIECWTLLDDDRRLVANKTGATRLGFALLLKCFELDGASRARQRICRRRRWSTSPRK